MKLYLLSTVLLSGFKAFGKLWNPLSKAVPGNFQGSDGHSKHNCLQDRADFHMFEAWEIVLIFNTGISWPLWVNGT